MKNKEKERLNILLARRFLQEAVLQEAVKKAITEFGINDFLDQPEIVPYRVLQATENLKQTNDELSVLLKEDFKERHSKRKAEISENVKNEKT